MLKLKLPKKNLRRYNQGLIDDTIIGFARDKKAIVYGARALNENLPKPIHKKTIDWDMYVNKPSSNAKYLEKKLDKVFGRDQFYTRKGVHEGTYNVRSRGLNIKSNKDDYTVADMTRPYEKVPYETSLDGFKFSKMSNLKKKINILLSDAQYEYRRTKDRRTLAKIKIYENAARRLGLNGN